MYVIKIIVESRNMIWTFWVKYYSTSQNKFENITTENLIIMCILRTTDKVAYPCKI